MKLAHKGWHAVKSISLPTNQPTNQPTNKNVSLLSESLEYSKVELSKNMCYFKVLFEVYV